MSLKQLLWSILIVLGALGQARADLLVVPRAGNDDPKFDLEPTEMTVHLLSRRDPNHELVFDASTAIRTPTGPSRVWLQGNYLMTPFSQLVSHRQNETTEVELPVGPAGFVTMPAALAGDDHLVLHLLHAGNYRFDGTLRWELLVRRPAKEAIDGILMPEGPAIAALWDPKSRHFVSLSRPFSVAARSSVEAKFEGNHDKVDLIVRIHKHSEFPKDSRLDFRFEGPDSNLAPTLVVEVSDFFLAFWCDLPAGPGTLTAGSPQGYLAEEIDLHPGQVEEYVGTLRAVASLTAELRLPRLLASSPTSLALKQLSSGQILEERRIGSSDYQVRFDGLPADIYELVLDTPLGPFRETVELNEGESGFVVLDPEVISLHGTVHEGDEGRQALLRFTTVTREVIETDSDDLGNYEIAMLQPAGMVSIVIPDRDAAPTVEFFRPQIGESRRLDLEIPTGHLRVRVLDATNGEAIPGANVISRNIFLVETETPEGFESREQGVSQKVDTNDEGVASLPPLRPGVVEVRAIADGYEPMKTPERVPIAEDSTEQEIEVRLQPVGETIPLRLLLPGGTMAENADVGLFDLSMREELFFGRTDSLGEIRVPTRQPGVVIVRHPNSAFMTRDWLPPDPGETVVWSLPPATGPIRFRAIDGRGSPSAGASLALHVNGRWLSGAILAFLTQSTPRTDGQGLWVAHGVEPGSIQVVAWQHRAGQEPNWLGTEVVTIPYPWPDLVSVPLVEWAD